MGLVQSTLPTCFWRKSCMESDCSTCYPAQLREVEVRWLVSGERVCAIKMAPVTRLVDVKQAIFVKKDIPTEEQRLFSNGIELIVDENPLCDSLVDLEELQLLHAASDLRNTNIACFHNAADFKPLERGKFTKVQRLANAIHGCVCEYKWRESDISPSKHVVVKEMPNSNIELNKEVGTETNEWNMVCSQGVCSKKKAELEDALTEIGIFCYLSRQSDQPPYLLRMLGALQDERSTWLVTERADGGELFGLVASKGPVGESQTRKFIWQLMTAVQYLDDHNICHRDVSLENMLLMDGDIRLMDFGMAVRSRSASGELLRYFRTAGKETYVPSECYVPMQAEVSILVPAAAKPGDLVTTTASGCIIQVRLPMEAVPGQICSAELWGYAAPPVDVFSSGICFFILGWGNPPWQTACLNDTRFRSVYQHKDNGMRNLLRSWSRDLFSSDAMTLLTEMLRPDPSARPTASQCLESPWFAPMWQPAVPENM